MYYKIADIHGNPEYNLKGITLINGKRSVFWSNKNAKTIGEAVVIFNNKQAIPINNNQICISLNGIEDVQTQKEMLKAFCEQLKVMGIDSRTIRFKFVVADEKVKEQADNIIRDLGINGSVLNFGDANKNVNEENMDKDKAAKVEKKIEDKFNNNREITGSNAGISTVVMYKNGIRNDIVVDKAGNKAYNMSNSSMSMAELMKSKYEELMKDPVIAEKLFNMSDEEVIKYVSSLITSNNKEYYMDNNKSNSDDKSNVEKATEAVAARYDGVGNGELGIVINDPRFTTNSISAVEDNGDDKVNVVNPESSSVGMNSSNSTSASDDIDMNSDVSFEEVDEEERDIDSGIRIYYIDEYNNVYDEDEKLCSDLYCDEENNIVNKADGKVVGVCNGNLKDMQNNMSNNKKVDRAKTRVYKKPIVPSSSSNTREKNAAFISLPVIIFIISLLLLIGSGIIWFMIK